MGWLQQLFSRRRRYDELSETIREHLDEKIADLMDRGMTREQAESTARREFGNVARIEERSREVWQWSGIERVIEDSRLALRRLLKTPGFTATVVLTLALGIGGATAVFSVVNGVILKPLPYPNSGRLLEVRLSPRATSQRNWGISQAYYFVFREQNHTFADLGLYTLGINAQGDAVNITGLGEPQHVPSQSISASVLPLLGIKPLFGRAFSSSDDQPGSADTVMLTYGYWRKQFGSEKSVIGKTITIDGKAYAIIGVLPKSFEFLDRPRIAVMLPLKLNRAETSLGGNYFGEIARLKPGATLAAARADVARMIPIVLRTFPPPPGTSIKMFEDLRLTPNVLPLKDEIVGKAGTVVWVLLGAIGLVLLIACANVANLLLLRSEGRQQEFALRSALGARRGHIASGVFAENVILALLGGFVGLGLAYGALKILTRLAPAGLPRLNEIGIDRRTVLFALAVSLFSSVVFGLFPVLKYAGKELGTKLREGGRSLSGGRGRHRSRGLLVIVQVALALVLLVASGLMIRTFLALTRTDPGFAAPAQIQTVRVYIPDEAVTNPNVLHFEDAILRRLESIPGVTSASISRTLPMDGSSWDDPLYARDHVYPPSAFPVARFENVAPGFFKTMGTPLLAGRDFTWSDIYNNIPVVLVSEKLAKAYWGSSANALGKQVRVLPEDDWRQVVGVIGNIHEDGMDREPPSAVYWPIYMPSFEGSADYGVNRDVAYVLRSPRAGSKGLANEIRQAVWSVDSGLPLAEEHTLDYYYTKSMARTSFALVMLALAGGMSLLLGIVGLYGVIAYSVSQRTHELGIRMALGAQRWDVLRLVLSQGMVLTAIGIGIGIGCACGLTQFLSALLYGVKPIDPLTFAIVALLLMFVAIIAGYIPARRAAKVEPLIALRYE
ncbi:MAG: ABC transporter permease [Acidobacteriaceae bacterium]